MDLEKMNSALALPLPEDIESKKQAGDFHAAIRAINARLAGRLPILLRARLEIEKERLRRLPARHPYNRSQAIEKAREYIPALTEKQFDALEDQGRISFIYFNGEKRYFLRFVKTLRMFPEITGVPESPESEWLDPVIEQIRTKGSITQRITLESFVSVEPESFVPGDYTIHLPFPIPCAQQSGIELLSGNPDSIAPEDVSQRTAVWHRHLDTPEKTFLRYRYLSTIRYADPLHQPAPPEPLYPDEIPVSSADLSEEDFIRFTPLMRSICEEVTAGAVSPIEKAWRIYDYITTHIKYALMRDYFTIDNPAEYCAVNGTGDCGLQALMFITLCRIAGIPARWQSGLDVEETEAGSHDWAQFWIAGWGWLFADPSFGGGAFRRGSESRRLFYFGNLDPMRMAANRRFAAPFHEPLGAIREDPTDNQGGEIARHGAEFPYFGPDTDNEVRTISIETL